MNRSVISIVTVMVLALTSAVWADWKEGDPYKMHYPQLPDPNGWDVNFSAPKVVADDWMCTASGPVSDVHLWFSYRGDQQGPINNIHLSIHADIPKQPGLEFSRPGALLWQGDFNLGMPNVQIAGPFPGEQGWYDPNTGEVRPLDHNNYWQLNITGIENPFPQEQGTIYWLDVSITALDSRVGWKTSLQHFNDDAVWVDVPADGLGFVWHELRDPLEPTVSLDMAFVITPEPGTLVLLGAGLALVWRRRKMD
jgi:hypothetical protein